MSDGFSGMLHGVRHGFKDSFQGLQILFQLCFIKEEKLDSFSEVIPDPAKGDAEQHASTTASYPEHQVLTILARRRAELRSRRTPKQDEEPTLKARILQCCVLNGGIYLFSILLFRYIILPFLAFITFSIASTEKSDAQGVWYYLEALMSYLFNGLWIIPLYIISRLINALWFQDIADAAYRSRRGHIRSRARMSEVLADTVFSLLIETLFLVQALAVNLLPLAGVAEFASFVHVSLLYALYAFEYTWFNMGWGVHQRLAHIEANWPYYLGFGAPLALLTSWLDFFLAGGLFSFLFPLFILSGCAVPPLGGSAAARYTTTPLRLFWPVVRVTDRVFGAMAGVGHRAS